MCGIVGISGTRPVRRGALKAAVNSLAHRGPDGSGLFVDEAAKIGLGHTRLSIIDLSESGAQPMTSHRGRYTITFNGEIYNFQELRAELVARGVGFVGHSDTEVLLEGYAEFGAKVLDKLKGIFAFAIFDSQTRELFLARDQLGVKPLYYAETTEGVVFGSEIKALMGLAPIPREIDASALRRYLTFLWCPGDQTLLRAVKKLEPGWAMVLREGRIVRRWSYWDPPLYSPRRDWTPEACADELQDLIDRCVSRQMVADVPVGAFLSGGLDSSSLVASAMRQSPDMLCFTIDAGREDGAEEDLPYARLAAAALGVELKEIHISSGTMANRLTEMPYILDEPLADPACLNVLFIAELARANGIKVLLSGAGGDDLFTGYRRHTALAFDAVWGRIPTGLRQAAAAGLNRVGGPSAMVRRLKKALAVGSLDGDARIDATFAWGPPGLPGQLLSPALRASASGDDVFEPFDEVLSAAENLPPIEKCLLLERRFFLADHNLTYTDKMSMRAGVETRVPLLDLELVEFATQIPVEWKHRGLTTKWILKQSQVGRLPERIIRRPKTGFGAPLREWLHKDMRDLVGDLTSPRTIRERGLFDLGSVARLQSAYARGDVDGAYTLLSVMCVELWCRRFVDEAPAAPEPEGAPA